MNICYFLGIFPVTSETFIANEIVSAVKAGHKITIARLNKGESVDHAAVKWIEKNIEIVEVEFPKNAIGSISSLLKFIIKEKSTHAAREFLKYQPRWLASAILPTLNKLANHEFDHIHVHFANEQLLLAQALSKLLNVPYSFTMHGYDIRDLPIGKENLNLAIKSSKCFFTVSKSNANDLAAAGIETEKLKIIPCGIDLSNFSERSSPYKKGVLKIVCVARLHPVKNHSTILEALSMLNDAVDFTFSAVGDGTEREKLSKIVSDIPRLKDRVRFFGSLTNEEVQAQLLDAHVHILSSLNEGMPVANMEAMAAGLVCIASAVGGLPEVIRDGENGFLFKPRDSNTLAKIIEDIYYKRINIEGVIAAAREDAVEYFDGYKLVREKLALMSA